MTTTVRFTRTYTVKADGGPTYEEGQVVELRDDSARHFVNRGAAVECDAPPEADSEPTRAELLAELDALVAAHEGLDEIVTYNSRSSKAALSEALEKAREAISGGGEAEE